MNRLEKIFSDKDKRKKLAVYYTCGCPSMEQSAGNICKLIESGADIIELGIPFSDPMADGPVIQLCSEQAIGAGATLKGGFDVSAKVRAVHADTPIVLFSYFNVIFSYGVERAIADFAAAGGDALLVVDLPFEEQHELSAYCEKYNIHLIQLIAPETPEARMKKIANAAKGFIYMVTVNGVTGERAGLPVELNAKIDKLKALTDVPVLAGFGVSDAATAKLASERCDGVIVGSAIMRRVLKSAEEPEEFDFACKLTRDIAGVLN